MTSWLDFRVAVRSLLKRPGFSLLIVSTLAVGIGTNAAVFAYLGTYLWPAVDAPRPDTIVRLETSYERSRGTAISYPDWVDLEDQDHVFSQLMAYRVFGASLRTADRTLHTWGHAVSAEYFDLFGARPAIGRLIQADDDVPSAEGVVVLNYLFWTRQFGADPSVIGETVYLNGRHPYTVIGVASRGFQGQGVATEIYVPLATAGTVMTGLEDRGDRRVNSWGRLPLDVTPEQAQAALAPLVQALDRQAPGSEARQLGLRPIGVPGTGFEDDPVFRAAEVLMVAVAVLLLLACANVANLLLARSESRRREMAVQAALGAGRARLLGQLLFESLLLSSAGGLVGLVLGSWSLEIIEHYLRQTVPIGMGAWGQATSLFVDQGALLAFTAVVSISTGLLFGLAPVARVLRLDLVAALKSSWSPSGARAKLEMRRALVVVQVALSVVLLLAAGLLVRTVVRVQGQNVGFDPDDLLLGSVYMPADRASDSDRLLASYEALLERVRGTAGVEAASVVQVIPLSGVNQRIEAALPGQPEEESVNVNTVGPGYLETMGIPLLLGRDFDPRDRRGSPAVAIVNQTAASRLWPGRDPVGQRVELRRPNQAGEGVSHEVVGVAADSRYQSIVDPIGPQIYLTFEQQLPSRLTFVVRSPRPIAAELRELLRQHDPDLAFIDLVPFREQLRRSTADQRMNADMAVAFGLIGLVLAVTGVFSVMSYTVSRRRRELAVRVALGASGGGLSRLVLGEAGWLVGLGVAIGLSVAWAVSRVLSSVLYGVGAHDLATFATVPLVAAALGLLAAWLPARRASSVDPMEALRQE